VAVHPNRPRRILQIKWREGGLPGKKSVIWRNIGTGRVLNRAFTTILKKRQPLRTPGVLARK
jgi:hypothetical protein